MLFEAFAELNYGSDLADIAKFPLRDVRRTAKDEVDASFAWDAVKIRGGLHSYSLPYQVIECAMTVNGGADRVVCVGELDLHRSNEKQDQRPRP
jgi:hypothetical protein